MSKDEKNVLGKVNAVLGIAAIAINSAIFALISFAPGQNHLIEILKYLVNVIEAITHSRAVPHIPQILIMATEDYHSGSSRDFFESLESENYAMITNTFGNVEGLSIVPDIDDPIPNPNDIRFIDTDPDCPRTV